MNDDSLSHFPVAVLNYGEYLVAYCGWCEADVKAAETPPEPAAVESNWSESKYKARKAVREFGEQIKFREFL